MIGSLRGTLLERSAGEVMVEVAGIGYRVTVSPATSVQAGEVGDEAFLHIHHHIREDAQTLYGFPSLQERVTFEALISAHGVGPALGLAILSVHEPAALQMVLATEDLAALTLVPGVGKKTAQRLLVELKSKLDLPDVDLTSVPTGDRPAGTSNLVDVREALGNLGYSAEEIQLAMKSLPADGDVGDLLKAALKSLAVPS